MYIFRKLERAGWDFRIQIPKMSFGNVYKEKYGI